MATARDVTLRSIPWLPVGFAAAVLLGAILPLIVVPAVLVILAAAQTAARSVVTVVVGAGGLLVVLLQAAETTAEAGVVYPVILSGFGGIVGTGVFVVAIGDDQRKRTERSVGHQIARSLVSAVAAVEVGLWGVSPTGPTTVGLPAGSGGPMALATVLLLATVVGVRYDAGYRALAVTLLAVVALSAVSGSPYIVDGPAVLAGTVLFAQVGALTASRQAGDEATPAPDLPHASGVPALDGAVEPPAADAGRDVAV